MTLSVFLLVPRSAHVYFRRMKYDVSHNVERGIKNTVVAASRSKYRYISYTTTCWTAIESKEGADTLHEPVSPSIVYLVYLLACHVLLYT